MSEDRIAETERRYPEREIFAYGRYINCQILNWSEGPPPQFIVCNPLHQDYREPFLARIGMGTWMRVDLTEALRQQSDAPTAAIKDAVAAEREACARVCDSDVEICAGQLARANKRFAKRELLAAIGYQGDPEMDCAVIEACHDTAIGLASRIRARTAAEENKDG